MIRLDDCHATIERAAAAAVDLAKSGLPLTTQPMVPGGRIKLLMGRLDSRALQVMICLASVVSALLIYAPSLTGAFEFDDITVWRIVSSFAYPWELLGHSYGPTPGSLNPAGQGSPVWRPLYDVAWWFEVALFGTNATLFHAANAALHGLTAGLLGLLAYELSGRKVAAALFASSLLLVQPFPQGVAWISGSLSSVISTAFYILAIYGVVRSRLSTASAGRWAALGVLAFTLSLGTYELALPGTIVVLICELVLDSAPFGVRVRRGLILAIPFAAASLVYLVVRRQMIGVWVGVYGASTILGYDQQTIGRLQGVAQTLLRPVHFTTGDRSPEQPLLFAYWLGLACVIFVVLFLRPNLRVALVGLAFAVAAFLPFVGFIKVNDVLDPTRYLYTTEAGLALTIALVLATPASRWLPVVAFLLLCIGSGGLLLRNEAPWHQSGEMVAATVKAAEDGPIQVFGVPMYAYEGGYTFGPDSDYVARYPGGNGQNVELGGPVLGSRRLLFWNGARLLPIGSPARTWTGSEIAAWAWADVVSTSRADREGVDMRSRGLDPFVFTPTLDLDGDRAQLLSLSMDLQAAECDTGQVIWHTARESDYLTYFGVERGLHTYVILAVNELKSQRVVTVRLDPVLCPATATIYRVSLGGIQPAP